MSNMPKRKIQYSQRSAFWPCGACRGNCAKDSVECSSCSQWFHYSCENLSEEDVKKLQGTTPFTCFQCLRLEVASSKGYSFPATLVRLMTVAMNYGFAALEVTAKREAVLMPPDMEEPHFNRNGLTAATDCVSDLLLQKLGISKSGRPISVKGDGNCLFNGLSMALFGNELYATQIRVRTCIQMCLNQASYIKRRYSNAISLISPTFTEATMDCATDGSWSSAWTMMAAADVLGISINSVYPPVNGKKDSAYKTLNRVFTSTNVWPSGTANIMWTHTSLRPKGIWTPNHFVPLVETPASPSRKTTIPRMTAARNFSCQTSTATFPPPMTKSPTSQHSVSISSSTLNTSNISVQYSSPPATPTNQNSSASIGKVTLTRSPSSIYVPSVPSSQTITLETSPQVLLPSPPSSPLYVPSSPKSSLASSPGSPLFVPSSTSSPLPTNDTNMTSSATSPRQSTQDSSYNSPNSSSCLQSSNQSGNVEQPMECQEGKSLPHLKLIPTTLIYHEIKNADPILANVPSGPKNNKYFKVDNSMNANRGNRQRSTFYDDCGVWDSSSGNTVKTHHVVSENMRQVTKKEGQYCIGQKRKGTLSYIPLKPQPSETDIVTLHKFYTALKRDNTYKKRVTWFSSTVDNNLQNTAVYEYFGKYPPVSHEQFIRTDPKTMQQIRDDVKLNRPQKIYADHLQTYDINLAPRDTKQIRNIKYRDEKKEKRVKIQNYNIADELLEVIAMKDTHPFIQEVGHPKNQVPSIICYTNEQLIDLKHFIKSKMGRLGIDRTFNLGPFFVTTLVYKNYRLIKKETKDHPLFLGPIFLHQDASYRSYRRFFDYISAALDTPVGVDVDLRISPLMEFGSDDEKALTKAIEASFPLSERVLCTKHLKDNLKHYMSDVAAVKPDDRVIISEMIFGEKGLVNAEDSYEFNKIASEITTVSSNEKFNKYFTKLYKDRIDEFVTKPRREEKFKGKLWTNNNSESMNNVLKSAVNWKPKRTPDLIDIIYNVVDLQFKDAKRSLYSSGNYRLTPKYCNYLIPELTWRQKSESQQVCAFNNFLRDSKKRCLPEKIVSADGKLTLPCKAQRIATKPGQRKRPRNERTAPKR